MPLPEKKKKKAPGEASVKRVKASVSNDDIELVDEGGVGGGADDGVALARVKHVVEEEDALGEVAPRHAPGALGFERDGVISRREDGDVAPHAAALPRDDPERLRRLGGGAGVRCAGELHARPEHDEQRARNGSAARNRASYSDAWSVATGCVMPQKRQPSRACSAIAVLFRSL